MAKLIWEPIDDLIMEWQNSKVRREQDIAKAIKRISDFKRKGEPLDASILTSAAENVDRFPNFLQLLAGTNITFTDDLAARTRTLAAAGASASGLQANRRMGIVIPTGSGSTPFHKPLGEEVIVSGGGGFTLATATELGLYEFHTSATAANLTAAISGIVGTLYIGGDFNVDAYCYLSYPDTTDVRTWWTFADGTVTTQFAGDNPATPNYCGFRFSTSAGDANCKFISRGTSGTQAIIDTGVTPPFSPGKWFEIHWDAVAKTLTAKIEGVQVAQITDSTKFPANGLGYMIGVQNLIVADKHLKYGQMAWIMWK